MYIFLLLLLKICSWAATNDFMSRSTFGTYVLSSYSLISYWQRKEGTIRKSCVLHMNGSGNKTIYTCFLFFAKFFKSWMIGVSRK